MNPYDLAHQLARALAESEEYREFLDRKKKLEANRTAAEMHRDFRRRQLELQAAEMMGREVPREKVEQFQRLAEIIGLHAEINAFISAEFRFSQLLADVQRIQVEAVEDWFKYADELSAAASQEEPGPTPAGE